jgi:predicted DNA-binding transcriptional regulator AlpA
LERSILIKALGCLMISDEVAKLTGYPQDYIPIYMERGKIPKPIGRLGRYHVWDREEMEQWVKENPPTLNKRGSKK